MRTKRFRWVMKPDLPATLLAMSEGVPYVFDDSKFTYNNLSTTVYRLHNLTEHRWTINTFRMAENEKEVLITKVK
jgi:hypothetical protein